MLGGIQQEATKMSRAVINSQGTMPIEFVVPLVMNIFALVENEIRFTANYDASLQVQNDKKMANLTVDYLIGAINESENIQSSELHLSQILKLMPRLKQSFEDVAVDTNEKDNLFIAMKDFGRQQQIARIIKNN